MTLSKLKQEGREEFAKPTDHFTIKVPPTIATVLEIDGEAGFEMSGKYYKIIEEAKLTTQIEKAYLSALSDVEKGLPKEVKKPARYMLMAFHNGVAGYHLGEADNYKFHPFESIGDYEDYANGHEDFAQNNTISAVKEVVTKLKESK